MASTYRGAGVYLFRTRRPGLIGRIYPQVVLVQVLVVGFGLWLWGYPWWWAAVAGFLLWPRHNAYVGESNAVGLRRMAHLYGGGKFKAEAKPWADLDPSWYFLPLPGAPKWVLHSVETVATLLLWPVYPQQKNLWNPRRIPRASARRQRTQREAIGWSFNIRPAHLIVWAALITYLIGG